MAEAIDPTLFIALDSTIAVAGGTVRISSDDCQTFNGQ
jgi:hypothetical protein